MTDRYDSYFQSFYFKMWEHWNEVYKRTKNPEAMKRRDEIKDLLYKKWLIVLEETPLMKQGQCLLFEE